MSEQALRPAASGTGSSSANATTGTHRVIQGGKVTTGAGNQLPQESFEAPDLPRLAQELNAVNRSLGRDLRFQVDLNLGYAVIQVLDSETGEIIRQIPQEKAAVSVSGNGGLEMRLLDEVV